MLNMQIKDQPLVTIIVPVYGAEKYIEKCLISIINQTYKNLEILLIDDGSKDRSGIICDEYAAKDSRIMVYHKENGGVSDARNFGIERATGEYLSFIDSDDYVDLDYIEFLMTLIFEGYKLALCDINFVYTNNGRIESSGLGQKMILTGEQCIEMMCYHNLVDTAPYAKIAHISLFENVRYPKSKIFEDTGTTYLLFDQCEQVICCFQPKYYYVIRPNSIVRSDFSIKKLDMIEMTDKMADYVDAKYPELSDATLRRRGYARFSTLNQMFNVKDSKYITIRKEIVSYLKRIAKKVIANPKVPKRDKLGYACLKVGFPFYKVVWSIYVKIKKG